MYGDFLNLPILGEPSGARFGIKISQLSDSNTNMSVRTQAEVPILKVIDITKHLFKPGIRFQ